MHHRAKLRQYRLNRGRNIAIFQFFKMAAASILDFWNLKFLTVWNLTSPSCSSTPISYWTRNFGYFAINKGYIAYFYCACAKRSYFSFRFKDVFSCVFIGKTKIRHISTSGLFGLLTLKACHVLSHPRWSFPSSLKLIRLSIAELLRCWCGYVTWPCDLDLWPYNLGHWSNMAGHVGNPSSPPSLKILRLSVLDLWVMMSAIGDR